MNSILISFIRKLKVAIMASVGDDALYKTHNTACASER